MERIVSILIGYLFGNILTAEIVSRVVNKKTAFSVGTGNPGMANMAKQYGALCGCAVLAGDLAKTFAACLICGKLLFPSASYAAAYAGLGAIFGHNFPLWHKFKGGKGVACTCAAMACISFPVTLAACVAGLTVHLISRQTAPAAVIIPAVFVVPAFILRGSEVGFIVLLYTAVMLQRNLKELRALYANADKDSGITKIYRRIKQK